MRGNESISSVEGTMSRGKSDRDLESVQILSERRKLHAYPEKKHKLAFQGECAAQKKINLSLEAGKDRRNCEQRNADIAL